MGSRKYGHGLGTARGDFYGGEDGGSGGGGLLLEALVALLPFPVSAPVQAFSSPIESGVVLRQPDRQQGYRYV